MERKIVTLFDIHVYQVMDGDYRAYVKANPSVQVWGSNKDNAIKKLAKHLANHGIPFDFLYLHNVGG